LAGSVDDLGSNVVELVVVGHLERVGCVWVIGDMVELINVDTIANTHGKHSDVFRPSLVSLGGCSGRVGAATVGDDDTDPRHAGPGSIGLGEHVLTHEFDGVSCVGATAHVLHAVNTCHDILPIKVHVEWELLFRVVAELHKAHVHVVGVDVKLGRDSLDKVLKLEEVARADAAGSIDEEHNVGLLKAAIWSSKGA
jgi:hypothetical protein